MTPKQFEKMVDADRRIRGNTKLLIMHLYDISKKDGHTKVGNQYLADKLHCTIRYVEKMLRTLEDLGYIKRKTFNVKAEKMWVTQREITISAPK